ncbi:SDR family NAD(P)-dependent oxidoreductase, partial [Priestia megaterium]
MELNLKNKVALVVASSQGLGKAIATQLVKEGVNVMLTSRDSAKLKKLQQELQSLGKGKVEYCPADITNADDIHTLINKTI